MAGKRFVLALLQQKVVENKLENIQKAVKLIKEAKQRGANLIALPECFNCPYGTKYFLQYSEEIPDGDTCKALSAAAKENNIYVVGGSIPEKEGSQLYNTSTVWNPSGDLIAKHRKVHLFDIDVPGMKFKESETLSPGNKLTTFICNDVKIGLGICYDIRFEEMARLYRYENCDMILYPGAFNMTTGPMHWELLFRARAVDNQLFTAGIAPAQDTSASYQSYGHSIVVSPWGKILNQAGFDEEIVYTELDLSEVTNKRAQIPTSNQRRYDLYETIKKA